MHWKNWKNGSSDSLVFFLSFCHFLGRSAAYGGSQARGLIRAVAISLRHSSRQHRSFNPLSEARNRTRNLTVPSRIHFCCTTTGTQDEILWAQALHLLLSRKTLSPPVTTDVCD